MSGGASGSRCGPRSRGGRRRSGRQLGPLLGTHLGAGHEQSPQPGPRTEQTHRHKHCARLVITRGLPPEQTRFARTHASWRLPGIEAEDLLVSLADTIWKGHRVKELEQTVLERITAISGVPTWQAFLDLDDTRDDLAT